VTPTQRTLAHLRKQGMTVAVVEHWNAFARVRQDLFGVVDVLALSASGETVAVQATSLSNVAKRITKIAESENVGAIRRCGWKLLVHGWGKDANGRVRLREVDVS
jgi:hypothetical protein